MTAPSRSPRIIPVEPPTNPETAIASSTSLTILADATNGTLFYDVDAKTVVTIKNFSTVANGLTGRFVRVAARYQSNGSLVAVRIWAANAFNSVWISPEGHVLHVNTTTDVITVQNELGIGITLTSGCTTRSSSSGLRGMPWRTPRPSDREPFS